MALCQECIDLNGKPGGDPPHANLIGTRSIDLGNASHGRATGTFEYYFCKVCSTHWLRDLDDREEERSWTVVKGL